MIVWITGLSGAGKTTVANILLDRLRSTGIQSVLLDGDQLRKVFGDKWGYTRDDRRELAYVYARLCRTLSDSGLYVICATVAMFEDVRRWNRSNNPNYYEVFLDVPLPELIVRDQKGLYSRYLAQGGDSKDLHFGEYELPSNSDITILNLGDITPDVAAHLIISDLFEKKIMQDEAFERGVWSNKLRDRVKEYWDNYYKSRKRNPKPSAFAVYCEREHLESGDCILDVGCGDGRDSFYLARNWQVVGVDLSSEVTQNNRRDADCDGNKRLKFVHGDFVDSAFDAPEGISCVYSRFVLHAMSEDAQEGFVRKAFAVLPERGKLLLEFRTSNDPLAKKGFAIGRNERITDHYRRFVDFSALRQRLETIGFKEIYSGESSGWAQYGDEDPVVGRIICQKVSE